MGTKASTDKKGLKHYADISNLHDIKGKIEFTPIIDQWIGDFNYVHNEGTRFFFQTNYNAPNGRVISFDIKASEQEHWFETLPENQYMNLQGAKSVRDKMVVAYGINANDKL